jgi:hypothetical protein
MCSWCWIKNGWTQGSKRSVFLVIGGKTNLSLVGSLKGKIGMTGAALDI